jgi:hypothetical protein
MLAESTDFRSDNSPPEKSTPSSLTLSVLMMASCPGKLKTNVPSGHFHFLMLEWPLAGIRFSQISHLLVTSRAGTSERILVRRNSKRSNGFFVMRERGHHLTGGKIPQP